MSNPRSSARFRFTGAAMLLAGLLFLLPALNPGANGSTSVLYLLAVLIPCAVFLSGTVLARMFSLDRMLLTVSIYLCSVGIAALALSDPHAALAQALRCGIGTLVLLVGGILIRSLAPSLLTAGCTAFLGLLLLSGKLLAPSVTFPLTEAALALLVIAFASLFARQGSVSAASLGCTVLILLLVQGMSGYALLWAAVFLLLLFAADGRPVVFLPSLAAVLILFFIAFRFFPDPKAVQSVPSAAALVSAGAVGSDTLSTEILSVDTVSLFPRVVGHYGLVFAGLPVLLFLPFSLRAASIAASSRSRFHAILTMGITLLISLRVLLAALSSFGILSVSLPGFPFLMSSTTDLCSQLFLTGLLCGVSGRNDADLAEDAHLAMLAK